MVLLKRLDYGFNGYQVPHIPRAARSARKRCLRKSEAVNQQMCAFDLLASVAGKLLLDGEHPPPSVDTSCGKGQQPVVENSVAKEEMDKVTPLEEKSSDRDLVERDFLYTKLASESPNSNFCLNEIPCPQNDAASRPASGITTSDGSEKGGSAEQLVIDDCKLQLGISTPTADIKSPGSKLSPNYGLDDESRKQVKVDSPNGRNLSLSTRDDFRSSGHLEVSDTKPSALVSSADSVKFPFCRDHVPCGSFPIHRDNVKLVNRDNDEKSSECTEYSTRNKGFRPQQHVGDIRIRKSLPAKYCKVTPTARDDEHYNADTERCNYLSRKDNLKRQRSLRDYPIKKRKLYDCSSVSNSDEGIASNGNYNVLENATNRGALHLENGANEGLTRSAPALPRVSPSPSSAPGQNTSFRSRNPQVKLKIKSFRVPELLIEIPETATVGSLKRTVMEAVNAVLGGGLRVGVILQGKKIRDDNKTLLQTGISRDNNMDTLGFALEPSPVQAPIKLSPDDRPSQLLHDSPQPLARYPPTTPSITRNGVHQGSVNTPSSLPGTNFSNFIESDRDSASSRPDMSLHKTASESKALVPVTATKPDPSAVVPMRKSKRSESAQRRIRRPFAVAEVEALVQAVEKLGTGRWRDVKLRAFDNAKHRTYVDLKDKWKTLVHTARISPQQRRGEPVPQELLDRVLAAHAYWSQHQAKQQLKSQPDTSLLL